MSPPATVAACHRCVIGTALLFTVCLIAGCQLLPKTLTESSKSDWEHSNLYNTRAPYPKLFVEIDAVAGQGPTSSELRELESFLREFCDKPGGITIKVDNVIPRRAVADRPAELLALEYLNGPPDDHSAFLYILFYNTRLRGKDTLTDKPSFSPQPHPIVWIDRSYRILGNPWPSTSRRTILLHEVGHALGLCAQTNHHATEGHCTNDKCRMNPSLVLDFVRLFTLRNPWINRSLCADCAHELVQRKAAPANPKYDFWHGYYRRREEGYQVLGLPGLTYVRFGDALSEPNDTLIQTRREALEKLVQTKDTAWVTVETFDPWDHLPAWTRFTQETDYGLRMVAEKIFETIAQRFAEHAASDADDVRQRLTDDFIATARDYPEQQRKLTQLRDRLDATRPGNQAPARAGN